MRDSAKTGVLKLTVAILMVFQTCLLQAEDFVFANKGGLLTITKYVGSGGTVTVPEKIDGLPVAGIGRSAFNRCTTITSVVIPPSVSSIEQNAFAGCTGLTNISFNSRFISFDPDIFAGCDGLKSLTLPNCKINPNSLDGFMGGKNIARVVIPHTVTNFGGTLFFEQNIFYPDISVDPKNPVYSSSKDGFFNKDQTVLLHCPSSTERQYVVPRSVRIISGSAFSGCEKLTSIAIHSAVTNINPDAFLGCPLLASIVVDEKNPKYSSSPGVLFDQNKAVLFKCPTGKGNEKVPVTPPQASGWKEVSRPPRVHSDAQAMFSWEVLPIVFKKSPKAICVASNGTLLVAGGTAVYAINPDGATSLLAGSETEAGCVDGKGSAARFKCAYGIAIDGKSNVFVSDVEACTIRKISSSGEVSTLAGKPNDRGFVDGVGATARFAEPHGICTDSSGNVIVADFNNNAIRKVSPEGVVTTLAGDNTRGTTDGLGAEAKFSSPFTVIADSTGNVFVAGYRNGVIGKILSTGDVTILAGISLNLSPVQMMRQTGVDGTGAQARFCSPSGIALAPSGNIIVTEAGSENIRQVSQNGAVTTIGPIPAGDASRNGNRPISKAMSNKPKHLAIGSLGVVYISDLVGNRILKGTPTTP